MFKSDAIPNPLLLVGATRDHTIELCKYLMGEKHAAKIETGNHPDLHLIEPEGKSHLHSVSAIHRVINEMGLPPFEASKKIFVFFEAEKMLPDSANALLKTLEEPASDTWFLFISDLPDRLLPTIISRLNPVQFSTFNPDAIDISPLLELSERGKWDEVFDYLETFENEDPITIFHALLQFAAKRRDSIFFSQLALKIEEGRKALNHNIKLKVVVLNILIFINLLSKK